MFRLILYTLFFVCGIFVADAQLLPSDPIVRQLKTKISDSARVHLLLQLGEWWLQKPEQKPGDLDSALRLSREAARLARRAGDPRGVELAAVLAGRAYAKQNRYGLAAAVLPTLSDTSRCRLLLHMAFQSMDEVPVDTSVGYSLEAIRIGQKTNNLPLEAVGWEWEGAIHFNRNEFDKGRPLMRHGWELVRRSKDIAAEMTYLFNMAVLSRRDSGMDAFALQASHDALHDGLILLHPTDSLAKVKPLIEAFSLAAIQYGAAGRIGQAKAILRDVVTLTNGLRQTDPQGVGVLSLYETTEGDLRASLHDALEAVRLNDAAPPEMAYIIGYMAAAGVYNATGDLQRAFFYQRKCADVLFRFPYAAGDPNGVSKRLVGSYLRLGRPGDALRFLDSARHGFLIVNQRGYQVIAVAQGDCYFALHRYDSAEAAYLESLKHTHPRLRVDRLFTYLSLAKVYMAMGQYQKARPWLAALTADSNRTLVSLADRRDAYYLFYQTDSAAGDLHGSIACLRQYQALNDSIFNIEKNKQITEMTTRYETNEKDQNIARLNSQALLRESDLRKGQLLRNGLIAGSVLLALLLAVVINRYRLKQRTNALLASRQRELDETNHLLIDLNGRQEHLIQDKQRLLEEKEWLMREVHHRVKNNLQIIISLLNMQASTLKDEVALDAFGDIRSRIRAISLIHQKLYREDQDVTRINMPEYIGDLTGFLEDSFALRQHIRLRLDIDAVDLDVAQCLPIGLILNEAVTNAIKYAFPPGGTEELPVIDIALKQKVNGRLRLLIADNGIGLPPDFDLASAQSMGFRLIRSLADQLGAVIAVDSGAGHGISPGSRPGLVISLEFPV